MSVTLSKREQSCIFEEKDVKTKTLKKDNNKTEITFDHVKRI